MTVNNVDNGSSRKNAADRSPRGQPYDPPPKKGGVEYKTPAHVPLDEEEQRYSILNDKGQEMPDPVPLEPPIGYSSSPSLSDFVHRMIRTQLSQFADDQEFDTFEEASDFDIEDDPIDPLTPYERVFFEPALRGGGGDEVPQAASPVAEPPLAKPLQEGVPGEVVKPAPVSTPNEKA